MTNGKLLLDVEHLRVGFRTEDGLVQAVDDVSFQLRSGEVLAIVGESGSGKSVSALTLMGLTPRLNTTFEGSATLEGQDLLNATDDELRRLRGEEIAMIFQDPMTSLNPVQRIGAQIVEQIQAHRDMGSQEAYDLTVELLERVGIPRARERIRSYPHEFSGGMRQRVMIAMALSCDPSVLIADEPTTALDVTIQAQILEVMQELRERTDAGIVLVTHDLGVVADIADRILVMYAGRVVEQGTVDEIFYDPQHPYTWGLLGSIARVDRPRPERLPSIPGLPPSLHNRPKGCHFRSGGCARQGTGDRGSAARQPSRPPRSPRAPRGAPCRGDRPSVYACRIGRPISGRRCRSTPCEPDRTRPCASRAGSLPVPPCAGSRRRVPRHPESGARRAARAGGQRARSPRWRGRAGRLPLRAGVQVLDGAREATVSVRKSSRPPAASALAAPAYAHGNEPTRLRP